jgi:hypothetical protein
MKSDKTQSGGAFNASYASVSESYDFSSRRVSDLFGCLGEQADLCLVDGTGDAGDAAGLPIEIEIQIMRLGGSDEVRQREGFRFGEGWLFEGVGIGEGRMWEGLRGEAVPLKQ